GVGTMGEALIQGIQASPIARNYKISGSTRSADRAKEVAGKHGIPCGTDNRAVAKQSDILLLAVKPHQAEKVVREIAPALKSGQLLVSICASVSLAQLKSWTGGACGLV